MQHDKPISDRDDETVTSTVVALGWLCANRLPVIILQINVCP
jgi:hypothetical protein